MHKVLVTLNNSGCGMLLCTRAAKSQIRRLHAERTNNTKVSSKVVRQQFLDYFISSNNYNFVRSSPVVPFYDPTVPFVNAGMNQFKKIFLGAQIPSFKHVANSQKCVRVGGKHNDLNVVGTDGFHHTFFEMLGNWTFGECSKMEACTLAYKLLTDVYKIDKNRLYVTYFAGDESLHLAGDEECKQVWRSLGIPESRILPFGIKENFWEMGLTGPCGSCTEIHFDHGQPLLGAQFVNKGLHELVELWNIVFIEYNRNADGSIVVLPNKHVDTGMGFERLLAVLQGTTSNYDTDIFRTIFSAIQKNCNNIPAYQNNFGENDWNQLHTGYRVLADHVRMITACLADGMIPEQNQKLRKIIRRSFAVSNSTFKKEVGLLKELSNYVIESLGAVYPEMERNVKQIHQIIDYEEEVYRSIRKTATSEWLKITIDTPALSALDIIEMPGLIQAYKDIKTNNVDAITSQFAYKLYDTYGLDEETVTKLTQCMNIKFDANVYRKEIADVKLRSKQASSSLINAIDLSSNLAAQTNDTYKYVYKKSDGKYVFEEVPVEVKQMIEGARTVTAIQPNTACTLILDKTNLYCEAGGQSCDSGVIRFGDGHFQVHEVQNINNYILHNGVYKGTGPLTLFSKGSIKCDEHVRLASMQNHTATHLLNAALKRIKGATCQKSSKLTSRYLSLDVGIFSEKLSSEEIDEVEKSVRAIIAEGVDVGVLEVNSQELLRMDGVTMIPGEIYPDAGIRLIEIKSKNGISREPCCGTHVFNTKDIGDFCIIGCKSLGRSTASVSAVTGDRAKLARRNGEEILEIIAQLRKNMNDNIDKPKMLEMAVASIRHQLRYDVNDDNILPVNIKKQSAEELNDISRQIKEAAKNQLREFIDMEMQSVLEGRTLRSISNKEFVVHYLRISMVMDTVPLHRATQICKHLPTLVISYADNLVKARCCVPENYVNENFNAQKWLQVTGDIFKASVVTPKGDNPLHVANINGKKIGITEWHSLLTDGLEASKMFATKYL